MLRATLRCVMLLRVWLEWRAATQHKAAAAGNNNSLSLVERLGVAVGRVLWQDFVLHGVYTHEHAQLRLCHGRLVVVVQCSCQYASSVA